MRIVYLLENAAQLWGGVKAVLEDANDLVTRGHQVRVLAKSAAPTWMKVKADFEHVPDFAPHRIPAADVVVGTFWTTVPFAAQAACGAPVHYCQGYEGDNAENQTFRQRIEEVYRLPIPKITISPHLKTLLAQRFGGSVHEVVYAIDHDAFRPGPLRTGPKKRVRIGLVGPWEIPWKDLRTGYEALSLANRAGLDLEVVRITNTGLRPDERSFGLALEVHERVPPARMPDLYRSMDLMLCTSSGPEEGFFLPAVEAMACGVPCIMTDVPCFRGYSDRQHALFVPPKDPAAMAEAIVIAATHPSVGQWLRGEGLAAAARFTRVHHVDAVESAFRAVIAEHAESAKAREAERAAEQARHLETLGRRSAQLASALREAAEAWSAGGDDGRALAHLEAAATIGAADAALLEALGVARFRCGDAAGAATALEHAIAVGANESGIWNDLGVARHANGDATGAHECFTKALALDPANADAAANLAAIART